MVYGLTTTVSGYLTGKVYLAYLPRYLVAIFTSLMTLALVIFLLAWERQPSYPFIFAFISLWGISDGHWNTFAPSKFSINSNVTFYLRNFTSKVCSLLYVYVMFCSIFSLKTMQIQHYNLYLAV